MWRAGALPGVAARRAALRLRERSRASSLSVCATFFASRSSRLLVVLGECGSTIVPLGRAVRGTRPRAAAPPRCRRAATRAAAGRTELTSAGLSRESSSSEISAEPRQAGSRPRARGAAARSSAGTGTGRSRGTRPLARGSRRCARAASSSSSHSRGASASSRSCPPSRTRRPRPRLGERRHETDFEDRAAGRRTGPTAGTGGRCASARGCAPTSRRRASTRTSRARAAAGSLRRRARAPSSTRRSSSAGARGAAARAPRARPPRVLGDLDLGEPSSRAVRLRMRERGSSAR